VLCHCGAIFVAVRKGHVHCSQSCRQRAYEERRERQQAAAA
jgi:hypothetical protein